VITQSRCKELLRYDPDTGELFWRVTVCNRAIEGNLAGATSSQGYNQIQISGKNYLGHRLIWLLQTGSMPCDEIDHINHDRLDNRWDNLREVTHIENGRNQSMYSNNLSGAVGVCWYDRYEKWQSSIRVDDKQLYLGRFEEINDALAARRAAEVKYGFHVNHGSGD
jgi:hypothetical protein